MRRILFILCVVTVVSGLTYAGLLLHYGKISTNVNLSLSPNWMVWLKFDEGNGSIAHDSTKYNNFIQVAGNNVSWCSNCKLGSCLIFNGGDCCVGPANLKSTYSKGWSISLWYYPFNVSGTYAIAGKNIQFSEGKIKCTFQFFDPSTQSRTVESCIFPKELESNKWYFVLCCLLYTSPSPRDLSTSRMPSSA